MQNKRNIKQMQQTESKENRSILSRIINRYLPLAAFAKKETTEQNELLNERKGLKDTEKETEAVTKRQQYHAKEILTTCEVHKIDIASLNAIFKDCKFKDYVKRAEMSINSKKCKILDETH